MFVNKFYPKKNVDEDEQNSIHTASDEDFSSISDETENFFVNEFYPKKPLIFECIFCLFITSNKKDFNRHVKTKKHLSNICQSEKPQKTQLECSCGKIYKDTSGLWRHKKKCFLIQKNKMEHEEIKNNEVLFINTLVNDNKDLKSLLVEQIKESNELKSMMMEVIKNGTHNITNSHNKTFNLQVFLNETCKDAMNIMDFVNSIEIDLDDLEKVGELGYVNGMTNIILKNLKALDITKRPMHCTDAKREIMYIKDDNKWEKETENKDKMKKALKYIIHKNAKMLNVFKAKYPDCIKSYSNRCDQYNKLVVEVLGGKGDNETQNNEKIIRKIAREVIIDKCV